MKLLTETFGDKIALEPSCYDRLVITGNMPEISHFQGMTSYLYQNNVKIFDYPKFTGPFKEAIRANAERIAKEHDVEIEFIRKSGVRKEAIISEKIKQRGDHP